MKYILNGKEHFPNNKDSPYPIFRSKYVFVPDSHKFKAPYSRLHQDSQILVAPLSVMSSNRNHKDEEIARYNIELTSRTDYIFRILMLNHLLFNKT